MLSSFIYALTIIYIDVPRLLLFDSFRGSDRSPRQGGGLGVAQSEYAAKGRELQRSDVKTTIKKNRYIKVYNQVTKFPSIRNRDLWHSKS